MIDARTVRASPSAPGSTQGYDGGKRVKGRKRDIATDTLGLLLVLIVTAAGVQDSNGSKLVRSLGEWADCSWYGKLSYFFLTGPRGAWLGPLGVGVRADRARRSNRWAPAPSTAPMMGPIR